MAELWLRVDPLVEGKGGEFDFDLRPGHEAALNPLTDESLAGMSREQIDAVINAKVSFLKDLGDKLRDYEQVTSGEPRYQFLDGLDQLTFPEVVAHLRTFLDGLASLLELADIRFGVDVPILKPAT